MSTCSCRSLNKARTLAFQSVDLCHREQLNKFLQHNQNPCCDLTFANMYVWGESYNTSFAESEGMLLIRCTKDGDTIYMPPIGAGDFAQAMRAIAEDNCHSGQELLRILCVTEREKLLLEELHPGKFTFNHMRDNDDYIHLTASLGELQGKKYHGKRGHVKKFQTLYGAEYRPMTAELIPAVLEMNRRWTEHHDYVADDASEEMRATSRLLNNFESLELVGGVLLHEGQVIAASAGSRHHPGGDTIVVHYEKGLLSYEGVYSAINNLFMADCMDRFTYANREEDMGLEGLRKSKLSYKPELVLEKYEALCPVSALLD